MDVSREQLRRDLAAYAALAEVDYAPGSVDAVLDALADGWTDGWLAVRTTTHPPDRRELSLRLTNLAADPVPRLRAAGLLPAAGHPVQRLLTAVSAAAAVRWGIDVATSAGVQKIWLEFPDLIEVDLLLGFADMPQAARGYVDQIKRWGGDRFALLALDLANRTVNLYSQLQQPGQLTAADIAAMLAELDFAPADEPELAAFGQPFTVYRTFSWTSPRMERICFPARFTRDTFPDLDPMLSRFVTGPTAGPGPHGCACYAAHGPAGRYFKAQVDYTTPARVRLPGGAPVPRAR